MIPETIRLEKQVEELRSNNFLLQRDVLAPKEPRHLSGKGMRAFAGTVKSLSVKEIGLVFFDGGEAGDFAGEVMAAFNMAGITINGGLMSDMLSPIPRPGIFVMDNRTKGNGADVELIKAAFKAAGYAASETNNLPCRLDDRLYVMVSTKL